MFGRETLALEIDIGSQVDHLTDDPAESDPHNATQNPHGTCLSEEKFLHVAIAGTNGFHDANLAAALKNCHHERVHNADRCDD